jgi:hypothetical protein
MNTPIPRTLQPDDFIVNQTWLAYRINSTPLTVENQEIDLYVLQDAGSMFLFGNAFAPAGSGYPAAEDVERLLNSAHEKRDEWPSELLLPGNPGRDNSFAQVAQRYGVRVRNVPESQLSFYIKDTQKAYEEFLGRGDGDGDGDA